MKRSLLEFEIDAFQVSSINQSIIHGSYPNIGADRIATVAAAVRQYADHEVLLVFDFGTATTLTAVDRAGKFLGGFISIGLRKNIRCSSFEHRAAARFKASPWHTRLRKGFPFLRKARSSAAVCSGI